MWSSGMQPQSIRNRCTRTFGRTSANTRSSSIWSIGRRRDPRGLYFPMKSSKSASSKPESGPSHTISDNRTTHHRFLRSLSLVCRRWYKILHPHYSRVITLKSYKHAAAQRESTLATLQELAILETGRLWFYRLLLSDVPQKMVNLVDMRRTAFEAGPSQCQTPRPLETVRSLMQSSFGQAMSLTLNNYSFSSWRAFAKIVFAFPEP